MQRGDDGGAGEDVGVGEVRPGGDADGAAGVLGLDGAWGRGCCKLQYFVEWESIKALGFHALPMSPNFRSSKMRNFFRRDISRSPSIVRSPKSSTMSAWVFSTQMWSPTSSARRRSAVVELTSAETQRFERLMEMRR